MPNMLDDWNLYLKIKKFVPDYLQPAFLYTRDVITIFQLREAINYFFSCGNHFTYDELEEARRIYQKQFFRKEDYV